jgi:hypothetical protein
LRFLRSFAGNHFTGFSAAGKSAAEAGAVQDASRGSGHRRGWTVSDRRIRQSSRFEPPQLRQKPLQSRFAARCSVRPVAGNTRFQGGKIEAQPRLYTFTEVSVRVDDDFDPFTQN